MQAARQGGRSARQGVVSRLDAAVRCSRRRRSLRGLPLGTAARPRSPFSGGRGRHPALGAVSAGVSLGWCRCPPKGGPSSSSSVIRASSTRNARARPVGWAGGCKEATTILSPLSPLPVPPFVFPHRRGSQRRCVRRAPWRGVKNPFPREGPDGPRPRYGISPATAQDMPWTGSLEETDLSGTSRTTEPAGRRRRPPGVDFACPRARRAGVDYGCRYCGDVVNVMKLPSRLASGARRVRASFHASTRPSGVLVADDR